MKNLDKYKSVCQDKVWITVSPFIYQLNLNVNNRLLYLVRYECVCSVEFLQCLYLPLLIVFIDFVRANMHISQNMNDYI